MLASLQAVGQQPAIFTQHIDNLSPINPAFSLFNNGSGLYTAARKQWAGVNGAPSTYLLNGSFAIPGIGSAAGFVLNQDELAIEKAWGLNLFFAKSIKLSDNQHLAVSLNVGVRQYNAQFSALDPVDPVARDNVNEWRPNAGFGVLWYGDSFYLGLSVPQLTIRSLGTASQQAATDFRSTYYFIGGTSFNLQDNFKFKPSALVAYTRGLPVTAYITGMLYAKDIFGFGASYHSNNEAAGIVSFEAGGFHIGYSYQFGLGDQTIGGFRYPTHELLIGFKFGTKR